MTDPVNNVKLVNDVTNNKLQSVLNEMWKTSLKHPEDFEENVMLHLFAGGATIEEVRDVVKLLHLAWQYPASDAEIEEEVYEFWNKNRVDMGEGRKSIHTQLVDYIETIECQRCKQAIDKELTISLQEIYKDLNYRNPNEKTACRMAVKKLVERDKLEIVGGRSGIYRIVQTINLQPMKFITEEIPDFPVILPLDLNDMVKIHPKNIIVIAGSKSAGKSMMALWIATANQHRIPIDYFNSEMGEEEYSERMKNMGFTSSDQIKFNMYPLHTDYDKYITDQKKIFIVDFLEVHDKFYEIAKPIRKIHEKLKDGICIVLIQMKPGADFGVGGMFSAEKARLYLKLEYEPEMQHTIITIADAKSPKQENIRGMSRRVKIIKGAKLSAMDNWKHTFKGGKGDGR